MSSFFLPDTEHHKVYEVTAVIHEQLNELYPTLQCGNYSKEEEAQLHKIYIALNALNQNNLDFMYPNRHKT